MWREGGSFRGTFVNEQRLSGRTPVQPGSRIQLGYTGPVLEARWCWMGGVEK